MKVAITGASGFVGRRLTARLLADGHQVVPIVRKSAGLPGEYVIADLIGAPWRDILAGCDAVIHLAARVHIMQESAADPLAEYRRVNRDGAVHVAEAAAAAGVRRFVFVSSIKALGESTRPGRPFRADDAPAPADPDGVSKLEAEQALAALARERGLELVIVRPPLVYGPGVPGNFGSMLKWIERGVPLPFGLADGNRRSLVGLDNLADFLVLASQHPAATGNAFLVSDDHDVSTRGLIVEIGKAADRKARLIPVPVPLMRLAARMLGKGTMADRLFGDLQLDIAKTRELLGWTPPLPMRDGMAAMARTAD